MIHAVPTSGRALIASAACRMRYKSRHTCSSTSGRCTLTATCIPPYSGLRRPLYTWPKLAAATGLLLRLVKTSSTGRPKALDMTYHSIKADRHAVGVMRRSVVC
eukprot:GHUV01050897.1.p1 GENE.GHUV01050897.1~~GHUV01050897.1.p1  ORF type:complete len:104 (+),score=16.68 GHUV01050897.1:314-625(+)